jgi:hypothetical protein
MDINYLAHVSEQWPNILNFFCIYYTSNELPPSASKLVDTAQESFAVIAGPGFVELGESCHYDLEHLPRISHEKLNFIGL